MSRDIAAIQHRDYQIRSRDAAFAEWASGVDATLLVLPTGTGKTVVSGLVVEEGKQQFGWRTLYLAHREELIHQGANTLRRFGFDVAIEMGAQDAREYAVLFGRPDVVVGTVQSLQMERLTRWAPDSFDLIIIDEAHHARSNSYRTILDWFRGYRLLGITATPGRGDGRNIGSVFRTKCFEYPLLRAIKEGWLVPLETVTCPVAVDLRGLGAGGEDFSLGELEERISPIVEELADALIAETGGRQLVVFTPLVGSAQGLAQALSLKGMDARYVAGTGGHFGMNRGERRGNLDDFRAMKYQAVVCCDLLIEGWDCPPAAAVGICRVTRNPSRYAQMVGRITRPCDEIGKESGLIIDFDWQTDATSKDITRSVDLFDDSSLDEDVIGVAEQIVRKGERNIQKAVEDAEEVVRIRRTLQIRLTGKKAVYQAIRTDPVGVGKVIGVKMNKRFDMSSSGGGWASDKQLGMLRHLGMDAPEGMSKWGASKLIDKLVNRKERGLATVGQVRDLLKAGVEEDLARNMVASKAALYLHALDTRTDAATQQELFQ